MFNNTGVKPEIESKNLMMVEDQAKHELLCAKKSELYASYFQDPALKSCAQQISNHHRGNFEGLINYLESHK
jgi:hypothetical protein